MIGLGLSHCRASFVKLTLLRLDQFERIVFLDNDMQVAFKSHPG
jgi:alpha-N-acetylglucosamine transferase